MPYSGADDPNLPANVKKMSAADRAQWVAIFNDVLDKCIKDGGSTATCEPSAFKQANGVIKKKNEMKGGVLVDLKEAINKLFHKEERKIKSVDSWDGSASRWDTAEAYCDSCLINVNTGAPADWSKALCSLPVRDPGDSSDTYVDKAVHAAAGGHGITQVKKPADVDQAKWDAAVKSAANKIISAYNQMDEVAPDAVYELAGKTPPENRMKSIDMLFEAVWNAVQAKDEQAWLTNIFLEDDGTFVAIIASEGKLFKSAVTYTNGSVTMTDWVEVELDFPEVQQSRTTIHRMKDGTVRWLSVSGSTVLNRSGQIDSKQLFDSFVQHIEETGEYPVRMFCHCGEQFVTGQADFVARDENLLITSGVFNDSELAKREIAAREADPGYWGESIGFEANFPDFVEVAQDIEIPVFSVGVLREVSSVPEVYAAAWFTQTTQFINEEVRKMLDKRAKEALVKLFDGDEAATNKWLEDNVDPKNRMIAENNMITRTTEEVTEPAADEVNDATEPTTEVTQETEEPEQPKDEPTLEIDDSVLEAIVTQLATRQGAAIDEALTPIKDAIKSLDDRVSALEKAAGGGEKPAGEKPASEKPAGEQPVADLSARLTALEEAVEKNRTKAWYEDLPVKSTLRVTHRPREGAETDVTQATPPAPETYAEVAESTLQSLDKLKNKY